MTPPPPTGRRTPRLIPVLDVMGGRVVRAVGGRRTEYQPIRSRLTESTEPVTVAKALLATTSAAELYVADLDAITGRMPFALAVLHEICAITAPLWLDSGLREVIDVLPIHESPHAYPILGIETATSPNLISECKFALDFPPVAVSIDLRDGQLLGNWKAWGANGPRDAIGVARTAIQHGADALILLDLARVGTGAGGGTEELLRAIRAVFPAVELIAGGGVKTWSDVDRLGDAGADAVLVASALHDGTVTFPRPAP